jgi:hypothetical protein
MAAMRRRGRRELDRQRRLKVLCQYWGLLIKLLAFSTHQERVLVNFWWNAMGEQHGRYFQGC